MYRPLAKFANVGRLLGASVHDTVFSEKRASPMTKRQMSEKLLAAAIKAHETEKAAAAARAEYNELFKQATSLRARRGTSDDTVVLPPVPAITNLNGHGRNGDGGTVVQRVFKFIQESGTAQGAREVHEATGIPIPSVRWAFVKLVEKGVLANETRGKYVVANPSEAEETE